MLSFSFPLSKKVFAADKWKWRGIDAVEQTTRFVYFETVASSNTDQ